MEDFEEAAGFPWKPKSFNEARGSKFTKQDGSLVGLLECLTKQDGSLVGLECLKKAKHTVLNETT